MRISIANAASFGAPPSSRVTAVVDVRRPHVERHRAQLEGHARDQEHQAEHQDGGVGAVHAARGDLVHVQRTGGAVDHRDTVEHEARGQCAEDEVLHRRFGRDRVVAAQRHQGVQRQRHQFQAQVDRQHAVTRDHDHLAQRREQREHVELAAEVTREHAALAHVLARIHQRDADRQVGEQLQQVRHRVRYEHVVEGVHGGAAVEVGPAEHCAADQGQQRQVVGHVAARPLQVQVDQQDRGSRDQQEDFGADRHQVGVDCR